MVSGNMDQEKDSIGQHVRSLKGGLSGLLACSQIVP